MNDKKRWFASNIAIARPHGLDEEAGSVFGVSVNTIGEAKGHGVFINKEFLESVVEEGNKKQQGVKARFGHPNMCSTALGTFVGRFKNFRIEEDAPDQVKADLFLSNSAKETPYGNLHDYVIKMAKEEPDMFGTSIVFTQGGTYVLNEEGRKVYTDMAMDDEKLYVEMKELQACDIVDTPANNDGLFSRFSQETIAGQVTEFFDLHPQVWEAIKDNDEMFKAILKYSDNFDEFINRYSEYRNQTEAIMAEDKNIQMNEDVEPEQVDALESEEVVEDTAESVESEEVAESTEALETEETEEALEEESEEIVEDAEEVEENKFSVNVMQSMVDAFGSDIAMATVLNGGDFEDAKEMYNDKLIEENKALKAKLEAKAEGEKPAEFSALEEKDNNKPKRLSDLWNK